MQIQRIKNLKMINQNELRYYHFSFIIFMASILMSFVSMSKMHEWIHAMNSSYFQLKAQEKIDQMYSWQSKNNMIGLQKKLGEFFQYLNQQQIIHFPEYRKQLLQSEEIVFNQRSPASVAFLETEHVEKVVDTQFHEQIEMLTANENKRILFIGDSMLKTGLHLYLRKEIQKQLSEYQTDVIAEIGTGLARPEVYSWVQQLENQRQHKYKAIFVILGTNDGQSFVEDKKIYRFATHDWDEKYSERVLNLTEIGCQLSERIYWIGQLPMRDLKMNSKMQHINKVVKSALQESKCAQWINTSNWLTEVDGQFIAFKSSIVEKIRLPKRIRLEDGIHLSMYGASIFSNKLIEVLSNEQGLQR